MNCQAMIDFLMDYLDGALPAEEHSSFEAHLNRCPPCKAYMISYRQCIELGKTCLSCEGEEPTPELPEELVKAILEARRQKQ